GEDAPGRIAECGDSRAERTITGRPHGERAAATVARYPRLLCATASCALKLLSSRRADRLSFLLRVSASESLSVSSALSRVRLATVSPAVASCDSSSLIRSSNMGVGGDGERDPSSNWAAQGTAAGQHRQDARDHGWRAAGGDQSALGFEPNRFVAIRWPTRFDPEFPRTLGNVVGL